MGQSPGGDVDERTRVAGRGASRRIVTPTPTPSDKTARTSPLTITSTSETSMRQSTSTEERGVRPLRSASDAQVQRELDGMRLLLGAMAAFALVGLPVVIFTDGASNDRFITGLALAMIAAGSSSMFVRAVTVDEFRFDGIAIVHALCVAATVPFLTLGMGMCTGVTGVFAIGILLFGTSAPPRVVVAAYLELAVGHLVIATLAWLGIVSTTGLGDSIPTPPTELALSALWVEGEYATSLAVGLLVRRRWSIVLGDLERAVRTASERDALLREVRAELDRAANLLGPGRFTGHDVGGFRLGDVIGRGGMGEVYAAERIADGTEAAVKLLQRGMLAERDIVARFEREAHTVAAIRTPHVTEVYEFGGPDAPIPYIAMERLRGTDLAAMLHSKGVLSLRETLVLVREVAQGLEVAHEAGVVHRDLKPNNLFHADVDGRRLWKILDFGIAKRTSGVEATLTLDQVLGTPQYMAPEQAAGEGTIDRRVDVHALTAIAYRALTGRLMWGRADVAQVLLAVASEIPLDPAQFADLPNDLALVLRIGLAKRPDDRFASASELANAFEEALQNRLAPTWRARGHRLLAAEPWGSRVSR